MKINSTTIDKPIPDSVTHLWFHNCDPSGVTIPDSVSYLRFDNSDMSGVTIPDSVTHLWFDNSDLSGVTIPDSVNWLWFDNCNPSNLVYKGKTYKCELIDGVVTMLCGKWRAKGDVEYVKAIHTRRLQETCYVAKCGDYYAHGATLKEAIRDAQEKALAYISDSERLEIAAACIESGKVTVPDFRALAHMACRYGIAAHLGLSADDLPGEMPLKDALDKCANDNHYGQSFHAWINKAAKIGEKK